MLDHVTIGVEDIERSQRFYDLALRPLGVARLYSDGNRFAGYGVDPKAFLLDRNSQYRSDRLTYRICGR
jgi:catechol 2,3-dioxygenase-like lactoylglutathione lyase family enzyme